MKLSDHDLTQLNTSYLDTLPEDNLRSLSKKLLEDLKEARERLNRTPETSSVPPSSREPWKSVDAKETPRTTEVIVVDEHTVEPGLPGTAETQDSPTPPEAVNSEIIPTTKKRGKPGRCKGSQGYSRELTLEVTRIQHHYPADCTGCCQTFKADTVFRTWTGHYELEINVGHASQPGIVFEHILHRYYEADCSCGHGTRAEPGRCTDEPEWSVALTEWHLCGPNLVGLIVCMALQLRVSRRKIKEFLKDWLHIDLSTSTINQCVHEAGRAISPVVTEQLIPELLASDLLHIDETAWKEAGKLVWLWAFVSTYTVVYQIGKRHRLVVQHLLGNLFKGFIMTDGFSVYRIFPKRLRCWAHLIRKARALHQSLDVDAQAFGGNLLLVLTLLMRNIYQLREDPGDAEVLRERNQQLLELLRKLCEIHQTSEREDCRKLAHEFLNDWEAIVRVVETPTHPLTNNTAERSLRHWVILRKVTFGSRHEQGSRVVALLASVIGSARLRQVNPWSFIAQAVANRRRNLAVPLLPMLA